MTGRRVQLVAHRQTGDTFSNNSDIFVLGVHGKQLIGLGIRNANEAISALVPVALGEKEVSGWSINLDVPSERLRVS
jgi:hypothetical protein